MTKNTDTFREFTITESDVAYAWEADDTHDFVISSLVMTEGNGPIFASVVSNFIKGGMIGGVYRTGNFVDAITIIEGEWGDEESVNDEEDLKLQMWCEAYLSAISGGFARDVCADKAEWYITDYESFKGRVK